MNPTKPYADSWVPSQSSGTGLIVPNAGPRVAATSLQSHCAACSVWTRVDGVEVLSHGSRMSRRRADSAD